MRLYLFRHVERENSGIANPSISLKGRNQAQLLSDRVKNGNWDKPTKLLASPKARAIATFEPLSQTAQMQVQILNNLDERQNSETAEQFAHRVRQGLVEATESPGVIFLVTHLDWIEEALLYIPSSSDLLLSQHQIWEPGQHMVFEIHDGQWDLVLFGGLQP